ncbi:bacteriocin-like protein [Chryseobacterium gallinarum]|uniref:bacteriocin-like protein n=1 Tax=Chryseobacterium gallinarum TaxID=1324352 RepID=UPI000A59D6E7
MKNLKKISRNELKIIEGGFVGDDSEGGYYKCCSNNSDACSECVYIRSRPRCSSGSYPVAC